MPPLFGKKDITVIEYGDHANEDFSAEAIKDFFVKIIPFKAAK